MERESIISKVKKCLALSKSANTNEAAVALKKAQRLMEEHQITQVDVDISDVTETLVPLCQAQKPPTYITGLAECVAAAFGCRFIVHVYWRQTKVSFLGVGAQSEIAAYAFDVLRRALTFGRKEFLTRIPKQTKAKNKTQRADVWATGWVLGVSKNVRKLAVPEATEATLNRWVQKNCPDLEKGKGRDVKIKGKAIADAARGYIEGEKQQLHHGVDGVSHRLLEASA